MAYKKYWNEDLREFVSGLGESVTRLYNNKEAGEDEPRWIREMSESSLRECSMDAKLVAFAILELAWTLAEIEERRTSVPAAQ